MKGIRTGKKNLSGLDVSALQFEPVARDRNSNPILDQTVLLNSALETTSSHLLPMHSGSSSLKIMRNEAPRSKLRGIL